MKWFLAFCTILPWSLASAAAVSSAVAAPSSIAVPSSTANDASVSVTQPSSAVSSLQAQTDPPTLKTTELDAERSYGDDGKINFLVWRLNNFQDDYIHTDLYASLAQDGRAHLYARFRNANDIKKYDYALGCGVRDNAGRAYSMARGGKGLGARKNIVYGDPDQDVYSSEVKDHWDDIISGNMKMYCKVESAWNLAGLWGDLWEFLKRYGPLIGDLISLLV